MVSVAVNEGFLAQRSVLDFGRRRHVTPQNDERPHQRRPDAPRSCARGRRGCALDFDDIDAIMLALESAEESVLVVDVLGRRLRIG